MGEAVTFKENDFVWAKMSTYPPWPAIVMKPHPRAPQKMKEAAQWIYFFGTHNYAWIEERNIHHFETMKEKYKTVNKTPAFKQAVQEAEEHIEGLAKDSEYKIEFIEYAVKERKISPKKPRKSDTTISGAKRPAKEKIKGTPTKKTRSSLSGEGDPESDATSAVWSSGSRPASVSFSPSFEGEALNMKNMEATGKQLGVLGIGTIGNGVIKNLVTSGHRVNIWNTSSPVYGEFEKYTDEEGQGAIRICNTPREVVRKSDIIFSCLTDPEAVKQAFQDFGISDETDDLLDGKGFVEMTGIDPETSKDYCELVESKGGQYLEAQLQGNRLEATEGSLIVLASGNKDLYLECQTCFKAMGKVTFYLGKVGYATKVNLIIQVMRGVFLAGLSEAFAMADKCDIDLPLFYTIFKESSLCSSYLNRRAKIIVDKTFSDAEEPLYSIQRDMAHGMDLSNRFRQPMPMVAAANEMFKYTRRLGYDQHDSSCIYQRARH